MLLVQDFAIIVNRTFLVERSPRARLWRINDASILRNTCLQRARQGDPVNVVFTTSCQSGLSRDSVMRGDSACSKLLSNPLPVAGKEAVQE